MPPYGNEMKETLMFTPESTGLNYSQLIGGVITTAVGGLIGFLSARRISFFNARQQAVSNIRASFAPQLAYLKSIGAYVTDKEEIRQRLHSDYLNAHAAELEKFRFFVKFKNIAAYDNACEQYEELLHPGYVVDVGDLPPSEFFVTHIRTMIKEIVALVCTVFFLTVLSVPAHALTPSQVFDKVKNSVVVVRTLDGQGKVKGQGSGVLLPSGRVATNCHVVEEGATYQVGRGKRLVSATIYADDVDKDICLLDAKSIRGKPVQFGKAASLKVGDPVYAVGAPKGLELSLSNGIVAQLRGGPEPLIQTTAAVSPGSSGGGLFDGQGRLVGLTTFYVEGGQSLNFAMPAEWIDEVKPAQKPAAQGHRRIEWVKRAVALETMEDWQGLFDWCRMWMKNEPKNPWAWYGLGAAFYHLDRYNDAIEAYHQAIQIHREHARAWCGLGFAYGHLNRYNEAVEAYHQSVRIEPEDAQTWYGLGTAYGYLKRYDDAVEAFRHALKIDPKNAPTWLSLGTTYDLLNRHSDAIEAYCQAIQIDPKYATAWYYLGVAYFYSGNKTAAMNVVQGLRRLDPVRADKLFNLIVPR
jgi:Flp pilus assembly protein TadD